MRICHEVLNLLNYPTAFMGSLMPNTLKCEEFRLLMKEHCLLRCPWSRFGKSFCQITSVRNETQSIGKCYQGNEKVLLSRRRIFWRRTKNCYFWPVENWTATFTKRLSSYHDSYWSDLLPFSGRKAGLLRMKQLTLPCSSHFMPDHWRWQTISAIMGEICPCWGNSVKLRLLFRTRHADSCWRSLPESREHQPSQTNLTWFWVSSVVWFHQVLMTLCLSWRKVVRFGFWLLHCYGWVDY